MKLLLSAFWHPHSCNPILAPTFLHPHSDTPILVPPFWHPQACEGEGGAEGLVGKAEEDPPGVRDHLLDGHGDVNVCHGDVHDDFGIESKAFVFKMFYICHYENICPFEGLFLHLMKIFVHIMKIWKYLYIL